MNILKNKITPATKAIIPVHLFGQSAGYGTHRKIGSAKSTLYH
ncbi:MAG: DegT/DnrJ/EryC1/StrS family aminotransferase [Chitinophagales bacterium]